jgi:hypothetical protein
MQTADLVTSMGPSADSVLQTGAANVTTAGTAVAVGTLTNIRQVLIQAKKTNSGTIYVGPASVANDNSNGFYLDKGDGIIFSCTTLAEIFINSTVNLEGVTYLCW